MWSFIKARPILSTIVAIIVFVILYSMIGGSSGSVSSDGSVAADPTDVAAGLEAQRIESQTQLGMASISGGLENTRLQGANDFSLAQLAATLHTQDTNASVQIAQSTLAAQSSLGESSIQAQMKANENQTTAILKSISAQTEQAQINASVAKAAIKASSQRGFLSKIFG